MGTGPLVTLSETTAGQRWPDLPGHSTVFNIKNILSINTITGFLQALTLEVSLSSPE